MLDISDAQPTNTNISSDMGETMARDVGVGVYHECSAKTREGVESIFQTAVQLVLDNTREKTRKSFKCLLL